MMTPKKPDIRVRFRVTYEVDVPIFGVDREELYEQQVKNDPQTVRENVLYKLFDQGYEARPLEPVDADAVKLEFVKYVNPPLRDYAEGLLPQAPLRVNIINAVPSDDNS